MQCVDDALFQVVSTIYPYDAAACIVGWRIGHVVGGGGWSGSERWTRLTQALAKHGVTVSFAPATEGISTTQIVEGLRATR